MNTNGIYSKSALSLFDLAPGYFSRCNDGSQSYILEINLICSVQKRTKHAFMFYAFCFSKDTLNYWTSFILLYALKIKLN